MALDYKKNMAEPKLWLNFFVLKTCVQRTTGANLGLFYEAHIKAYFSGLQNGRDVWSVNTHTHARARYATSPFRARALLCGLCCVREKVGGKAKYHGVEHIPWSLILTNSFLPSSVRSKEHHWGKNRLSGLPCFYFLFLTFPDILFNSTFWILCTMWMDLLHWTTMNVTCLMPKSPQTCCWRCHAELVFILLIHFNV